MKHKHYDKIVAKSANMNLVVFCRDAYHVEEGWFETPNLPIQDEFDYYLCLPQHKEACLAWLNGVVAEDTPWTIYNNTLPMSELTDDQASRLFVAWRNGNAIMCRHYIDDKFVDIVEVKWVSNFVYQVKCKSERDEFVEKALTFTNYKGKYEEQYVAYITGLLYDAGCRFV